MLKVSRVIDVVITCNICLENVYNCTCNKKSLTKRLSSTLGNIQCTDDSKSENSGKFYFKKFLSKKWSSITNLSFNRKKEKEEDVVRLKNFYKNLLIHFSYLDENEVLKNTTIESKNGNWKFT